MTLTEEQVTSIAHEVMGANGLLEQGWRFEMRDSMPGTTVGHCHWSMKTIRLSRNWAFKTSPHSVRALAQHEVAHALAPDDMVHGDQFEAKLKEIRSGA